MGVDKPDQATAGATKPPRADQLVVQLTQGLQSKDGKLLTVSHSSVGYVCKDGKLLTVSRSSVGYVCARTASCWR